VISSRIQQPDESRSLPGTFCLPHPIRTPGRQILGGGRCVVCVVVTASQGSRASPCAARTPFKVQETRHGTARQETGACSCNFPIGVASSSERTAGAVVTREQVDKGPGTYCILRP